MEPPGIQIIEKDEGITLEAKGQPKEWNGVKGIYTWSCIAHPEGATFEFKPDGPTLNEKVKFFTDLPGIYTFKVHYQLMDAMGTWTYALGDSQVLFGVETEASIHRAGDYSSEDLKPHLTRPYYRERTVKEQPGAEIMVRNKKKDTPLGQDFVIKVLCAKELEFIDTLRGRALYKDGNKKDFKFVIDSKFRNKAELTIRSAKVIDKFHLLGIQYKNLAKHKGDAVAVEVIVKPLAPPVIDLLEVQDTQDSISVGNSPNANNSGSTDGAFDFGSNTISVVIDDGDDPRDVFVGDTEEEKSTTLVNLILRTRDLGLATASNCMVGLSDADQVNLANGNQHFSIPLFESSGMGISFSPILSYNSKAATRAEAIALYGKTNGIKQKDLVKEFGPSYHGKGWSSSIDVNVFEFIDIEGNDILHPQIIKCAEVTLPDGNRIAFKEEFGDQYHVKSEAETIGNDPTDALSLVLYKEDSKTPWKLEDKNLTWWKFDKSGLLSEMSDPATRKKGADFQLRFEWSDTKVTVTDSAKRKTKIKVSDHLIEKVEAPDNAKITFTYLEKQLQTIELPLATKWTLEYYEQSLMNKLTLPDGNVITFKHYPGEAVGSVEKSVAEDFWGRVFQTKFKKKELTIAFNKRVPDNKFQGLICSVPGGHEWRYHYGPKNQAMQMKEYANSDRPNNFIIYSDYSYEGNTKLPRRTVDSHGFTTTLLYAVGMRGKSKHLIAENSPQQIMRNWKYDQTDRLKSYTDEENASTGYTYNKKGQLERLDYPEIQTLSLKLKPTNYKPVEEYEYDNSGRITKHLTADGVKTTYQYGASPSGKAISKTTGSFTEKMKWDKMGRLTEKTDHLGEKTTFKYDDLGRMINTSSGGLKVTNAYDQFGRVISTSSSAGKSTNTAFNEYGEVVSETNPMGHSRKYQLDVAGNIVEVTGEEGNTFKYKNYDALGRYRKMINPDSEYRPNDHNDLFTAKMPDVLVRYNDQASRYDPAQHEAYAEVFISGKTQKIIYYDFRDLVIGREEIFNDKSKKGVVSKFNKRGDLIEKAGFHNNKSPEIIESARYNLLGEAYETFLDGVSSQHYSGRDKNEGLYLIDVYPSQTLQEGADPTDIKLLDDNDRIKKELGADGKPIKSYEYSNDHKGLTIKSINPALKKLGNQNALQDEETYRFDKQGRVTKQTNLLTGAVIDKTYDLEGRLTVSKSKSGTVAYSYDEMDRIKEIKSKVPATGSPALNGKDTVLPGTSMKEVTVIQQYDKLGRLTAKGSTGSMEKHSYDELGRVKEFTQTGLGGIGTLTRKYFYNENGERKAEWLGKDLYTTYELDHQNLKTIETLHDRGITWKRDSSHDMWGNIIKDKNESHQVIQSFGFDSGDRITKHKIEKGSKTISDVKLDFAKHAMPDSFDLSYGGQSRYINHKYDSDLSLKELEDSEFGGTYRFDHNASGRNLSFKRAENKNVRTEYEYYSSGRVKSIKHLFGNKGQHSFTTKIAEKDYDRLGNPSLINYEYLEDGVEKFHANFIEWEKHTYDKANRLVLSTFKGTKAGLFSKYFGGYGKYLKFVFPNAAQLFELLYSDTKAWVEKEYAFDQYDRRILEITRLVPDLNKVKEKQVILHEFKYGKGLAIEEEIQRWYEIGATSPKIIRKKYLFDEQGRRTHTIETLKQTGSNKGEWASMTRYFYGMDQKPYRTAQYELRGNRRHLLIEERFIYSPDGEMTWSRNRKFGKTMLAEDDTKSTISGSYAETKDFDMASSSFDEKTSDNEFFYVYTGSSLVALLDKNGKIIQEFLNGEGANDRIARRLIGKVGEYHNSYNGTSFFLTNNDGEIEERFPQTGSYGESIKSVPEAVHAGMWANLTSFLQTPARTFDPSIGQFMAPDPLGISTGLNLYSYALNNPVSFKDPSGQYWETAWDVASLSIGWISYKKHMEEGEYIWAAFDAIGIAVDLVAVVLPIPGGAGAALRAFRSANEARKLSQRARAGINKFRQAYRIKRAGSTSAAAKTINFMQFIERTGMATFAGYRIGREAYNSIFDPGNSGYSSGLDFLLDVFTLIIGVQKYGGFFMKNSSIRQAYRNRAILRKSSQTVNRFYHEGQVALRNKDFRKLQDEIKFRTKGVDIDDIELGLLKRYIIRNLKLKQNPINAFLPTVLKTGPVPNTLSTLSAVSYTMATLSAGILVHDTSKNGFFQK